MNGIALLQELVRQRFRAYPVPDSNDPNGLSCLVYLRGWRTGVLDTVIVRSYDDAQGFRTCNVDPSVPILRANGITLWHRTGSPADVAARFSNSRRRSAKLNRSKLRGSPSPARCGRQQDDRPPHARPRVVETGRVVRRGAAVVDRESL